MNYTFHKSFSSTTDKDKNTTMANYTIDLTDIPYIHWKKHANMSPLNRLESFNKAPEAIKTHAQALASSGFHFTKNQEIQCPHCLAKLNHNQDLSRPLLIHTLLQPDCTFIQKSLATPKSHRLLSHTLKKKTHKLVAQDHFQAIFRLKHYITFPSMDIDNSTIDTEANHHWNNNLHPRIRHSFKNIYPNKQLRMSPAHYKFVKATSPQPQTPRNWFVRTTTIKKWSTFQHYTQQDTNEMLAAQYHGLPRNSKKPFITIATIDKKRCEAIRLENLFLSRGFSIGGSIDLKQNITVTSLDARHNHVKISDLLFEKIAKLMTDN